MNIWAIVATVLTGLVGALSPTIKNLLKGFLVDLYKKAKATDNPVDDILVIFLAGILGVDLNS